MTDDTIIINPVNIVSKISIWLTDISKPNNYQHIINEIVYYVNGQWSTRSIPYKKSGYVFDKVCVWFFSLEKT